MQALPTKRRLENWLVAYKSFASHSEAPDHMHLWAGVSAIAATLRRNCWLTMGHFSWYPNFYICLVAPPGIVSKTTTASIAMRLVRKVDGIKFGPDVATWESLAQSFAASREEVWIPSMEAYVPQCSITLESGELGNLLDPENREQIDFYTSLWDGKEGAFTKQTKTSGVDEIINPWINIIGCTTPGWLAENFTNYMVSGGFTSRTIFVFAEAKKRLVPYPFLEIPPNILRLEEDLVEDLASMAANFRGPVSLTPAAIEWGTAWYENLYNKVMPAATEDWIRNYYARKQCHLHKIGMVLAAAESDTPVIDAHHLQTADLMLSQVEDSMYKVFQHVGKSKVSANVDRILDWLRAQPEPVLLRDLYNRFHHFFPSAREFGEILKGLAESQKIALLGMGSDAKVKII